MNFAPEPTGIGKYSGEMAADWVSRGHEVVVVCAPPYYPRWHVEDGHSPQDYRVERPRPGLTIVRCPVWLPKQLNGLKRLLHLASFALSSLPMLLALALWRPALVFAVAPGLMSAPAGWLLARLSGARAWLHLQDLEVDAAFELGLLKGGHVRAWSLAAERRLLRSFDTVSTISRNMLAKVVSKGVPHRRMQLLPNWVDLTQVRPQPRSQRLLDELAIGGDRFVALFSGTLNRKQAVDLLIEAARRLASTDPRIVIVICGNGELRSGLEQLACDLGNVRFGDLRPIDELGELLSIADVHLLPQRGGAADLVMPSKLTGMLASGRPVIASALRETEIAHVIAGTGLRVEPESVDGFVHALRKLSQDPALCQRLGHAAWQYAESHLGSHALMTRLNASLQSLCDESATQLMPERVSL
ncbi:MAG: WcaI family glycosyltransferase [Leptothrix sp. (in: b-proteobacteria)]